MIKERKREIEIEESQETCYLVVSNAYLAISSLKEITSSFWPKRKGLSKSKDDDECVHALP